MRPLLLRKDGEKPVRHLEQATLRFFQCIHMRDILHKLYDPPIGADELACFALEVEAAARRGDAIADEILYNAAQALARTSQLPDSLNRYHEWHCRHCGQHTEKWMEI